MEEIKVTEQIKKALTLGDIYTDEYGQVWIVYKNGIRSPLCLNLKCFAEYFKE